LDSPGSSRHINSQKRGTKLPQVDTEMTGEMFGDKGWGRRREGRAMDFGEVVNHLPQS
jgi:hypothetical protein